MKKIIISIAVSLSIMSFSKKIQDPTGKDIYEKNCAKCHGKDGAKKAFGVKSLQKSILSATENYEIITNGKGKMPSWKATLTPEQINQVIEYLDILKQKPKNND